MTNLKELVKFFDALGWIPTIRGALSLDLIGNGRNLLGDVDKYAVEFVRHTGLSSSHYIAATSLMTVNDTKAGIDICRTFRYMFVGAISDVETNVRFVREYGISDEEILSYIKKDGMLLGKLVIVTEDGKCFSDKEADLLKFMYKLNREHEKYGISSVIKAVSMSDLADSREQMYSYWKNTWSCVCGIATDDTRKSPTYCFDVALTRDGILLLKDTTMDCYKDTYCKSGTFDDYTQNVPLHRLFKVSMNYMKYLFHINYHHNVEHDAFLPASNLHPSFNKHNFDLNGVFRHQLNAFLNPITRMKRNGFADYTMDANGVLLYAKAFVEVFKKNGLVTENDANKANCFIELQRQEIEHMTQQSRMLVNTVMSQHNWLLVFSGVLAFVVAVVKIITSFVDIKRLSLQELSSPENFDRASFYAIFILILFLVGYVLYYISHSRILSRRFVRKRKNERIYFGDSNTEKRRMSIIYQFVIWLNTQRLLIGIVWSVLIKVIFWLLLMIAVSVFVVFLRDKL